MFTGRIIKRAFRLGDKKEEKKEEEEKFCDTFKDLMEEQKTLGKKFRKAIKDEELCVQMPDIVHEFNGKSSGRRFTVYRSDPESQNVLGNGKEIDRFGFQRYLGEDNSSLIDLQKKEFDGISLKEILEKAKENDNTFDKSRMASVLLMVSSKEKFIIYNDLNNSFETENQHLYGPIGAYYNEENSGLNIYNLMEIPFWYYFK